MTDESREGEVEGLGSFDVPCFVKKRFGREKCPASFLF